MFDNLKKAVEAIESGLTLKTDYSEELEELQRIEGDIAVFRRLGVPVWKCQDLREKIKNVREWMQAEMEHTA